MPFGLCMDLASGRQWHETGGWGGEEVWEGEGGTFPWLFVGLSPTEPPMFGILGSVKGHGIVTLPWRCGARDLGICGCPPGVIVDSKLEIKFSYR